MPGQAGKYLASVAGLYAATIFLCGPAAAVDPPGNGQVAIVVAEPAAQPASTIENPPSAQPPAAAAAKPAKKRIAKKPKPRKAKAKPVADNTPPLPPGPLHVIVSLDRQTATLFAGGVAVASSPISSGTKTHPTPMGVFSVLQKNRHHVSNLYGAPMPYMQRLTWSGVALHHGPLPGYPASHGCVRMTKDFSELLWKATRIGARVIVTRNEAAPVEIAHPSLFVPRPAPTEAPSASLPQAVREAEARMVRTADASDRLPRAVVEDSAKPLVVAPVSSTPAPEQATKLPVEAPGETAAARPSDTAAPAEAPQAIEPAVAQPVPANTPTAPQPAELPASPTAMPAATANATGTQPSSIGSVPALDPEAIAAEAAARAAEAAARAREVRRKASPVSVFVSRHDRKLYVRQGMEPLFDVPVTITNPERPIGTHVYTAMGRKDDGLRWAVVSIPSSYPRAEEPAKSNDRKQRRNSRPVKAEPVDLGPPSDASDALGRIVMPPEAVARIARIVKPGSSLIVSDNRLSGETGKTTDFIVETR